MGHLTQSDFFPNLDWWTIHRFNWPISIGFLWSHIAQHLLIIRETGKVGNPTLLAPTSLFHLESILHVPHYSSRTKQRPFNLLTRVEREEDLVKNEKYYRTKQLPLTEPRKKIKTVENQVSETKDICETHI